MLDLSLKQPLALAAHNHYSAPTIHRCCHQTAWMKTKLAEVFASKATADKRTGGYDKPSLDRVTAGELAPWMH
jgi:hypothetical protein